MIARENLDPKALDQAREIIAVIDNLIFNLYRVYQKDMNVVGRDSGSVIAGTKYREGEKIRAKLLAGLDCRDDANDWITKSNQFLFLLG